MSRARKILGLNLSIRQKIIGGFLSIILIFNINGIFSVISISSSEQVLDRSSEVIYPSIEEIQNLRLLITSTQMYITNWVYNHITPDDKSNLKRLQDFEYTAIKDRLIQAANEWENEAQRKTLDTIFVTFERIKKEQKRIMNDLADYEAYENKRLILPAEERLNTYILPTSRNVLAKLDRIYRQKQKETQEARTELKSSFTWLKIITIGLGVVLIVVGLIAALLISGQIVRPIKYINEVFVKLGSGELPEDKHFAFEDDEIGQMAASADRLVNNLRSTSLFAENIGKGNYQASYEPLSEKDVLGNALLNMRDNLSRVAEEDRRRNWQNEGLAKFSELLRTNNNDIEQLSDNIISNLVKYIRANQGGLFIVSEKDKTNDQEDQYMMLASCYAWDKKKYLEQKVYRGEGLSGQAWLEQHTIYLTEVPQEYVMITSGLGEANPNSILIVPLKVNEEVYGVVELASFNTFQPYEIEFVEKVAESIASAIASVKISERTKALLEESTIITQQMRSKEEEVKAKEREVKQTKEEISKNKRSNRDRDALLNATSLIIETDEQYRISHVNPLTALKLQYEQEELLQLNIETLFESYNTFDKARNSLQNIQKWADFVYLKDKQGQRLRFKASATAVVNEQKQVEKYLFLLHDIGEVEL
jgi:GAF domain-containing protein